MTQMRRVRPKEAGRRIRSHTGSGRARTGAEGAAMSLALLDQEVQIRVLELKMAFTFSKSLSKNRKENTYQRLYAVCKSKVFTRRSFTEVCQPLPWGVRAPRLQLTSRPWPKGHQAWAPQPTSPNTEKHTCSAFLAFSFPCLGVPFLSISLSLHPPPLHFQSSKFILRRQGKASRSDLGLFDS